MQESKDDFQAPDWERFEKALQTSVAAAGGRLKTVPLQLIEPLWRVRLKCQVPLCEYYGVCKICPPNIPGVDEFKAALESYDRAYLLIWREPIKNLQTYQTDFTAELKLAELVHSAESLAFQHGFDSAMGLVVGGCKLCPECTGPDEPCRHPYKARPSPEGFGIDITAVARKMGVAIQWPPESVITFLGLLFV